MPLPSPVIGPSVRVALAAALLTSACAYVMPASWRSYRADLDDVAPAITRALDRRGLTVADWNQAERRMVTQWELARFGVDEYRERYVVSWEHDDKEGVLRVFVRHERQDRDIVDGVPSWSATEHDADKERGLLDTITQALVGEAT